jgi:hypothetical protein
MATVASDDFSEADSTLIDGKSLDVGGTWTAYSGSLAEVQSGKYAEQASSSAGYSSLTDLGVADGIEISADFYGPGSGALDFGLYARCQDVSNGWLALIEYSGVGGNGTLRLYEMPSFAVRDAVNVPNTTIQGTTTNLKVGLSGNDISVYLNGVLQFLYSSSSYSTETLAGVRNYVGAGGFVMVPIDNFLVASGATGSPWYYYAQLQ